MARTYATAAPRSEITGSIREIKQVVVDITINLPADAVGGDAEVVLTVNGRKIKTLQRWQAERMGIVAEHVVDGY